MVSKSTFGNLRVWFVIATVFIICVICLSVPSNNQHRRALKEIGVSVNRENMKRDVSWAIDHSFLLLGRSLTQSEITKGLLSHNRLKYTLGDMERFANEAGINAEVCRLTWEELIEIDAPIIVWLNGEKFGIVDTCRKDELQVKLYSTPGLSGKWLSRSEIESMWDGVCLVMRPGEMASKMNGPSAMWERLIFDFGTVGPDYRDGIAFKVHNVGDEPLSLEIEKINCNCIKARLDSATVPSGGVSFLRLQTDFTKLRGRNYSFYVLLSANDGRRYIARVVGRVLLPGITSTEKLHFGDIAKGDEKSIKFHIYDRGTHNLRFKDAKILLDERYSDGIDASIEFIHWGGLSYIGDVVTDLPIEPGDYIAVVKIKANHKCSLETFKGLLILETNQVDKFKRLEIPIDGEVIIKNQAVSKKLL